MLASLCHASMLAALVSTTATLCVSPPVSCVWRLLPSSWFSSASSVLRSLNSVLYLIFFFFFLVSFLWFWVSLSSFLLLSPLLEPSLLFFLLSVRSLLGAVAVTPPKKKESTYIAHNMFGQIKMKIPWYNSRHTLILEKEVYFYQMLVILHKGSTYCTFKIIPRANIVFCPAG